MIKITNLKKTFKKDVVLKNINLELPRFGLVVIHGESGSGKSTLLNCLSGLLPFEGSINIDGVYLEELNEKEKDDFRLSNIGFVFQDFKLFENDTVINNILLPLDILSNIKNKVKEIRAFDLMELVSLKGRFNSLTKTLSGGEKQRVAIARALINEPKIILADEPTGSLDASNSEQIMSLLEQISKSSLVVVVSHDKVLTKKYADLIIELKDGVIVKQVHQQKKNKKDYLPINSLEVKPKRKVIPISFLIKHAFSCLKERKWRSIITGVVVSLGLIGVGLSTSISDLLSSNIKNVYSSIVDDSKIMMRKNNQQTVSNNLYYTSYLQAQELMKEYPQFVDDIGICYFNDFENMFPHSNTMFIQESNKCVEYFTARNINDFVWLSDSNEKFYPEKPKSLDDDEIVVSLTIDAIEDICFMLQIPRTVSSLSNYLNEKPLKVYFRFANNNWFYDDEQTFLIRSFCLSNRNLIYHYNPLWNEVVFETQMRFPSIDNQNNLHHPYDLRKIYYLKCSKTEKLLINSRFNKVFDRFNLEIANEHYYPFLFKDINSTEIDRLLIFVKENHLFLLSDLKYLYKSSDNILSPIIGSSGGYSIYPDYFMMGFSKKAYFSSDLTNLNNTLDSLSGLYLDDNESLNLPSNILPAHFSLPSASSVTFSSNLRDLSSGKKPESTNEIVVSSGLKDMLGIEGDFLFIGYTKNEVELSDGNVFRDFDIIKLHITGIVHSDRPIIYHQEYWSILFFQVQLGISIFELEPNVISFDMANKNMLEQTLKNLRRSFPQYEFISPLNEINLGIEETCKYVEIFLFAFSSLATLISIILLTLTNYLSLLEIRKDIGLARCLGTSKFQAQKLLITQSMITCSVSYILSCLQLVVITAFSSLVLKENLSSTYVFSLNPLSFLYMFLLATIISLASSLILSRSYNKRSPLELLY